MNELTLIEKAFFLKKTKLFSDLDLDLVLAIADKAEQRSVEDKEPIFLSNQDAHCLYVIVSGKVAIIDDITDEESKTVAKVFASDFFGDESLFNREPRGYTAEAYGTTELLLISRSHLIEIILECPQVALALIRAYAALTPFRNRKQEVEKL
jgi:CRP/FNR family transcriptional regulator, cyclic AMP receptor protein